MDSSTEAAGQEFGTEAAGREFGTEAAGQEFGTEAVRQESAVKGDAIRMINGQRMLGIDHIPGYAALVLAKENDICLIEAGKKYMEFFSLEDGGEEQSVLWGLSDIERRTLCARVAPMVRKREGFSYSRKAPRRNRETCWIQMQASYLEDVDGVPVYVAVVEDITDSVLTKMQLEETVRSLETVNRELDSIFDTVIDGVAKVVNREGYPVIFANESFYHMIGYTREQFEQECGNQLARLNGSDGQTDMGEVKRWQYRRRDGTCCWNRVDISWPGETYEGVRVAYVIFTDINLIIEKERELDRKIYYQTLIDSNSPAATLIRSAKDLRPLYLSGSAMNQFDYSEEEILDFANGNKRRVVHPEDLKDLLFPLSEHRENYNYAKEFRVKRRDGGYAWCYEVTRLEHIEEEEPVYISTFLNITDLKESQEQTRIREDEYRIVVEHGGKMVYRYDIRYGTLDLPAEAGGLQEMMVSQETIPMNMIEAGLIAQESEEDLLRFCDGIRRGDGNGNVRVKCRLNDNGYRWYKGDYSTVYDNDGKPVSVIIVAEDITSQIQKDAELTVLKGEQKLLSIIKAHTDRKLFRYDVRSHTGEVGEDIAMEFGIPRVLDDMPYDILAAGVVAPESMADYEEMFRNIQRGCASGKAVIRKRSKYQGWARYRMDYTTVFSREGEPEYAVISYQNIEGQYVQEIAYIMLKEMVEAIPDSRFGMFGGILAENRMEEFYGGLFDLAAEDVLSRTMDETVHIVVERWICDNDKKRWEEFNNRNWLMYMYDSGIRRMSRDFLMYSAGGEGKPQRIRETSMMFTNPYTGQVHICCMIQILDLRSAYGERRRFTPDRRRSDLLPSGAGGNHPPSGGLNQLDVRNGGVGGKNQEEMSGEGMARPAGQTLPRVYIRTFGYFDVFVDGQILGFPSKKGKELLAILVDRHGGICSTEEAISILWENEPMDKITAGRYRQTVLRLKNILEEAGIGDIMISKRGGRCVDTSRFTCDLYQFLSGEEKYRNMFHYLYMTNYSWGENTLAMLSGMITE